MEPGKQVEFQSLKTMQDRNIKAYKFMTFRTL